MSVSTCVASLARQFSYWLSCSLCFPGKCRLLAKGCGYFVPKWVWLGISLVRERFQSRSSLFSQNRAILWAFKLLQYLVSFPDPSHGGGGGRVWEHRYTKVVLEERNLWLVGRANTSRAS